MRLAIITDLHFGARQDSQIISNFQRRFYQEVLFPYIDDPKNKIDACACLGDSFDRRKYTNHLSFSAAKEMLFLPMKKRKLPFHILVGNHDATFKNTNKINTIDLMVRELSPKQFSSYAKPTEIIIDGCKILMMPWICPENLEESLEIIQNTDANVLFGHLELAGFEMYRGTVVNTGFDSSLFDKFEVVLTGHFHHKSIRNNIYYLGSPYEMTWSDYGDIRGFHVFDTTTKEVEFVPNPFRLFHIIEYNDTNKELNGLLDEVKRHEQNVKDCYVKVIVKKKLNPFWFDKYIEALEGIGLAELQIIEETQYNFDESSETIDTTEDTLTTIKKYATSHSEDATEKELDVLMTLLSDLYHAAQQLE